MWEKEKLLVLSIFSFSHNVFKSFPFQCCKNQELSGEGLIFPSLFQIWRFSTGAPIFSSPSLLPCDWKMYLANDHRQVVFGSHDAVVYCLSTPDSALRWKMEVKSTVYSTPFYAIIKVNGQNIDTKFSENSEKFVLETGKHTILPDSFDKETVEREFKKTATSDKTFTTQGNVLLPVVVVCSTVGVLYVMDARTGRILCERTLPGELFSSPILYKNSILVGCRDNNVYRLNLYATRKGKTCLE